jgi:Alternative complex III, ActD subunit
MLPSAIGPRVWGLLAEFETPDELLSAAARAREAGYRRMDAYTPFPIHGLSDAMGFRPTKLPLVVLAGGLIGCVTALGMMWYSATIHYPLNVGGRPFASWPAFIPITFELTVLFASLSAVFGMLGMNGLPMPYHPVFNAPRFALASRDRFFFCIEARDPLYEEASTRAFLNGLGAREVVMVEE